MAISRTDSHYALRSHALTIACGQPSRVWVHVKPTCARVPYTWSLCAYCVYHVCVCVWYTSRRRPFSVPLSRKSFRRTMDHRYCRFPVMAVIITRIYNNMLFYQTQVFSPSTWLLHQWFTEWFTPIFLRFWILEFSIRYFYIKLIFSVLDNCCTV